MKNNSQSILIIFSVSIFLASCSQSPEDYGKKIAAKQCDCEKFSVELEVQYLKQVIANAKSGKYKSNEEFTNDMNKAITGDFKELYTNPERKKTCDEFRKMDEDSKLKFPKEEDRKTVFNSYSANWDEMRKELNQEESELIKEAYNLPQKFSR
ncbi:MAG: hypothetical protein ABI855_16340 [Bacteroidota bacterium]